MTNRLISIVVPIYQIDKYLGLCIESLINQTYKNLEIILVDDGSHDRCPDICDLYARKDKRIKVIHKANGGLVSARKAGIKVATGEYVGYVDGDDWVGPGFYESLYHHIETADADVVCAGFQRDLFTATASFTDNLESGVYEGERLDVLKTKMLSNESFFNLGISTYVWNKLFRRELLLDAQLSVIDNISIGEDAAVTYPALLKAKKVVLTDVTAYHYRQREDSMLKQKNSFEKDAEKLMALHSYMSSWANAVDKKYHFQRQIDDFVLGICIIRSGDTNYFGEHLEGKRLLIYSAGTFGQQLMNRLRQNPNYIVAGWVDDDYWEYRRCCMDVDPVERVSKDEFDYVLVATINPILAEKISSRILDYGISENKILKVKKIGDSFSLLKKYLPL